MDGLTEWPEPVVPVESLAHLQTIPDRYVKPPEKRANCIASPGDHDPSGAIPVVDLAALTEERVDAAVAEAVAAACRGWGFFQAVNHGVPPELMRRFAAAWSGFFRLPVEDKRRYANSPATYEGYGSRLGVDREAALDWNDYYFLHLLPCRLKDHRKWPQLPPELSEATEEYGAEVRRLCWRLMRALSAGLGLQEDRLAVAFGGEEEEGACMRINFYPKCPQPELALGLSPHSDPGGLTVLLPYHHAKGLQVRRLGDGAWVAVHPLPDAFVINVADQIQILSNARYKSVEHRVAVNAEEERMSAAYFYNPRSDVPIEPLPELMAATGRAALYQPMTFDEYRLYIRRKGPQGKSQLSELYDNNNKILSH